jgi:hypothetical protein
VSFISYSSYLFAVPARASWPEYKITIDYEADSDSHSCDGDESNSKSLVMQKHSKPDDLMQSWMDQFEVLNCTFSLIYTFASMVSQMVCLFTAMLCRLMLTTSVGHILKNGSQENQSKY